VERSWSAEDGPGRAVVRNLFLRLLGLVFLGAFLSLLVQVPLLVGPRGLLPAGDYLRVIPRFLDAPTVFRLGASDAALRAGALAGAVLALGLVLDLAPRYCLIACWALYLSFAAIG